MHIVECMFICLLVCFVSQHNLVQDSAYYCILNSYTILGEKCVTPIFHEWIPLFLLCSKYQKNGL